ncbi:MAG: nucleotidyl transferase AbiEii/AbiGii toxin family protein [Candidatus Omnitrophica bacterium]|nr:nucleotidyl transferase AbiEii/AbiGii toxin family protein [Candidatus Omnitrophota bacterium]
MKASKLNFSIQKRLLTCLAGKLDHYYLVGGTALSLYYFQHRESYDLDFFTKSFSPKEIAEAITCLRQELNMKAELVAQKTGDQFAKIMMYTLTDKKGKTCKIDFVEDFVRVVKPLRDVDGIYVVSLEDIYLRKLYAVAGHTASQNDVGQHITIGGRQEAKDFYDLYCLSSISTPLAKFVARYGTATVKEGLIRWYRTFDRMAIKTGMLDLITEKTIDFRRMDQYFKNEVDALLAEEVK